MFWVKKHYLMAFLVVSIYALGTAATLATDYYWDVADGDWSVGSNWTPTGPPITTAYAYIDNDGTARINSDAKSYRLYVGYNISGIVCQTGGIHAIGYYLYLGYCSGSSGTYNLIAGEFSSLYGSEYIGYEGTGVFNQTSGIHTTDGNQYFGYRDGTSGTYNQTNGTNTVDGYLSLGHESGSIGTYNMSAGVLSATSEYIGYEGTGTFNQIGGINTVSYMMYIGDYFGSSGTYNLSAGILSVDSDEYIGYSGTGTFNQDGGTNSTDDNLYIGYYGYHANSNGTYNLTAGTLSADYVYIGLWYESTGKFNQTGGTHISNYLYVGNNLPSYFGSNGRYNLYGGSLEIGGLQINGGWMDIDLSEIEFFHVMGNKVDLLDGYILDGKIFDSSYESDIWAVYDSENDWTILATTETFIPEPSTMALIAAGVLGLAGVARRKML